MTRDQNGTAHDENGNVMMRLNFGDKIKFGSFIIVVLGVLFGVATTWTGMQAHLADRDRHENHEQKSELINVISSKMVRHHNEDAAAHSTAPPRTGVDARLSALEGDAAAAREWRKNTAETLKRIEDKIDRRGG